MFAICIDAAGCDSKLTKGKRYWVKQHPIRDNMYVPIKGHWDDGDSISQIVPGLGMFKSRFAAVSLWWECTNNTGMETILTVGKVYKGIINHGDDQWLDIDESDSQINDGAYLCRFRAVDEPKPEPEPEPEKEDHGEFIVWSPDSEKPPKKRYYTYHQARYVARKMSGDTGDTFYVMRAECKYTTKSVTTKTEL